MLYIGIPTIDSNIHSETFLSIMQLKDELLKYDISIKIDFEVGSLITRCRQNILKRFYNTENADYLLFIDSDISGFEYYIISMILFTENRSKSVIGLTYQKKKNYFTKEDYKTNNVFNLNLFYTIQDTLRKAKDYNGFVKVKHLPTGCLLIPRAIVSELLTLYPKKKEFFNFFDPFVVSNGLDKKYLSEDYAFCELVNTFGSCFVNIDFQINHHQNNNTYSGNYKEYLFQLLDNQYD